MKATYIKPIFVITGNTREFEQWCQKHRISPSSPLVQYIPEFKGPDMLGKVKNPEITSWGTFNMRRDFKQLDVLVREKSRPEIQVKIVYVQAPPRQIEFTGECHRKVLWRAA